MEIDIGDTCMFIDCFNSKCITESYSTCTGFVADEKNPELINKLLSAVVNKIIKEEQQDEDMNQRIKDDDLYDRLKQINHYKKEYNKEKEGVTEEDVEVKDNGMQTF